MIISVMQWNAWYDEKPSNIVSFLKQHPADIICLQELLVSPLKNSAKFIAEQLGYNYYCHELPITSTTGDKLMLADGVFSKFPILSKRYALTKESSGLGGYNDESRSYVEVVLDIDGKNLTVGTTHMSYTHKFEPNESKRIETDILLSEVKKHNGRYILAGDFNALPGSYAINSLTTVLENAGPNVNEKTWTTIPFSYNGFEANTLDWRLDYIFTSKDITVKSSEIITTEYSDHLPIFALLEIV